MISQLVPNKIFSLILGIESLEKCIRFWEDSIAVLRSNADCLPEDDQTNPDRTLVQLEKILDAANNLHKLTEELFLDEVNKTLTGSRIFD